MDHNKKKNDMLSARSDDLQKRATIYRNEQKRPEKDQKEQKRTEKEIDFFFVIEVPELPGHNIKIHPDVVHCETGKAFTFTLLNTVNLRLFTFTRILFHWNEEMREENHSKPTYSEQREIECQTELVDAHYEEEEDDDDDDDDDGLYGLLKLPQDNDRSGQYPSVQDISNINTEQLMKMESLKKNDFTINSKNLLRWTKVITPSKFAEQPVEEASWEILSKTYSKKVIHTAGKHKKVIPKKAKTDSKHLQNISLFNPSQANDIVQEEGMFIAESIDATNLENTQIPNQYLGNQTILANVQNIISSETFSEPNNSFQTTPIQNKQFIAENITQVVIPFEENIVTPEEQYREEENKLEQVVHFQQETVTGVDISQQHLKQENNSQIMKNVHTNTQTYTKQQQPTLNLEKLIETLRNHGKGINTLDHLLSNEEGQIKVNGAPLKFILVEQSGDANLPNTEILTSTNEHDTIGNIKYFVHSSIKAGNLSDIPSKKNTYSMPLVSDAKTGKEETPDVNDLLKTNLIAGSLDKDKLKADEYHEMLKAANKILRTKVSDKKNLTDKERKYRCDVCSASFKKSCKPVKSAMSQFLCGQCSNSFCSKSQLLIHLKEHRGEDVFYCKICNKPFLHEYLLKRHKVVHSDKKPYKCRVCKVEFSWISSLRTHIMTKHKDKIKEQEKEMKHNNGVDLAGEITEERNRRIGSETEFMEEKSDTQLDAQISPHTENVCAVCNQCFVTEESLKEHYRTHNLDWTSSTKRNPEKLRQLYKKDKFEIKQVVSFQCDRCKKILPETERDSHSAVHARYPFIWQVFQCNSCPKTFYERYELSRHIQSSHVKDKPHICTVCDKKFAFQYELKKHLQAHNKNLPFKCNECPNAYEKKKQLNRHFKNKHPDNEKQSFMINKLILCTETESENFGEHIEEEIMKSTPVQSYAAQTDIQTEISTNQIKDLGRIIQESKQIENVKQNNSELNESPSVMRTQSNPPCLTIFRTVDDEVVVNDVDKESGEIAVSPTHQSAQESLSSNTENEMFIYVDQNTEESQVELPLEVYSDMQNSETTFQYLDPKSGTLYQVSSEESNTYEVVVGIKDDEVDNKDITADSTENGKTDEKEHSYVKVSNVFIPSTKYEN
ncbi:KRAB [Mytilus coruscus]|uniref:KRAB n=1 Tax=Mytilus coruscus TaxID=42192 RepID=A0A6J8A9P3_MYTCO|nr:KRAB [Mytilus coruscus]